MRILVTNDDGIDGPGLHALVERLRADHDDLIVVAPHTEQSGTGAALGSFYLEPPRVHRNAIDGVDVEAWSVEGPPGLAVLLARLGAFGEAPDVVVSGINPGLNVGRAVYHSGTIGAALTARNGHIHGIAVSQAVDWDDRIHPQHWASAAELAAVAVTTLCSHPPGRASVLNLNVPDLPLDELRGVRTVPVGDLPPGRAIGARLVAREDAGYDVELEPSDTDDVPASEEGHDTAVVTQGWATMSWLGRITHEDVGDLGVQDALDAVVGAGGDD